MAIPGGVVRFVFSASNTGGERVNTGFWVFLNTSAPTQSDLDTLTTDAATLWNTFTSSIPSYLYTSVSWIQCLSYYYDGSSDNAALQGAHALTANPGTQSTAGSPIDTCLVLSLRTGLPGRNRRGRMYMPCHAPVLATTGNIATATANVYGVQMATLMNGWSAGHAGWVAVVSRTSNDNRPVTQVLCDTRPDVQRRRENKLPVTSVSTNTVTP